MDVLHGVEYERDAFAISELLFADGNDWNRERRESVVSRMERNSLACWRICGATCRLRIVNVSA